MSKKSNVVVFACNWDGLSCIEAAAQRRLTFPASVKIVRVSCLSRVHTGLMLQAFEFGANGVMLLGCDARSCHFGIEEDTINSNYKKASEMMQLLGLKKERLEIVRLPHGDASGFIKRINDFVDSFTTIT